MSSEEVPLRMRGVGGAKAAERLRNAIVQPHAKVYTNNAGRPRCVHVVTYVFSVSIWGLHGES
jgi:hypothetical protein